MSKILAIETATEACSAALSIEGIITSRFELAPRAHTKLILPMMEEVLDEAGIDLKELDAVAFSRGPGAFTGLRIAAGVAQGVALSIDKPVVTVSTLEALALQASKELTALANNIIISTLDARMGEVYWCVYSFNYGELTQLIDETVSKPEMMLSSTEELIQSAAESSSAISIGSGWEEYVDDSVLENDYTSLSVVTHQKGRLPNAIEIVELSSELFENGKAVPPEEAQPIYLRNNVAEKPKKQLD